MIKITKVNGMIITAVNNGYAIYNENEELIKDGFKTVLEAQNYATNTTKENEPVTKENATEEVLTEETPSTEEKTTEATENTKSITIPEGYEVQNIATSSSNVSALDLVKRINKGKYVFNNAVQRSDVWNVAQKSALITSMLYGLPVPNLYANKTEDGTLDFLDGKQRSHAVADYLNNEFELEECDPIILVGEDEKTVDINGFKFNELPKEFQHLIETYSFNIRVFDNIEAELANDIFDRLNSGTSLTAVEKSRVKAISIDEIQILAKHSIFDNLSAALHKRYVDEDLVTKCLKLNYCTDESEAHSLDVKFVRPYMRSVVVTDAMIEELTKELDILNDVHDNIASTDEKADIMLAKKIVNRTNLVTIIGFIHTHKDVFDDTDKFETFIKTFFKNPTTTYQSNSRSGSGHSRAVDTRLDELDKAWK